MVSDAAYDNLFMAVEECVEQTEPLMVTAIKNELTSSQLALKKAQVVDCVNLNWEDAVRGTLQSDAIPIVDVTDELDELEIRSSYTLDRLRYLYAIYDDAVTVVKNTNKMSFWDKN